MTPCLFLATPPSLPFPSLCQYCQAWQAITAFSIFYFEKGSTPTSHRAGLCPKPFPALPHANGQHAFMPIMGLQWTHSWTHFFLLWDCLAPVLFSLAQSMEQEGIFTSKSLHLWEAFFHAHVLARGLLHPWLHSARGIWWHLHISWPNIACAIAQEWNRLYQHYPMVLYLLLSSCSLPCVWGKLCFLLLMVPHCLAKETCFIWYFCSSSFSFLGSSE